MIVDVGCFDGAIDAVEAQVGFCLNHGSPAPFADGATKNLIQGGFFLGLIFAAASALKYFVSRMHL